jgi:hypothetical protein
MCPAYTHVLESGFLRTSAERGCEEDIIFSKPLSEKPNLQRSTTVSNIMLLQRCREIRKRHLETQPGSLKGHEQCVGKSKNQALVVLLKATVFRRTILLGATQEPGSFRR